MRADTLPPNLPFQKLNVQCLVHPPSDLALGIVSWDHHPVAEGVNQPQDVLPQVLQRPVSGICEVRREEQEGPKRVLI